MTIETTSAPNELAHRNPDFPVVTGGDLPGLGVLRQWADANDQATRLVAQWVWTDLVPLHHWPNPAGMTLKTWPNPRMSPERETDQEYRRRAEIATASAAGTVLRGMALGLHPNIALEQMHSIHGKIGMMTKLKYSLALDRGVKVWDVKLSETEVICAGIHPATGETIEIGITMAQAIKAKWNENEAYQKTPIDMLWSRAMSRVLDRVAGHVLFGLASIDAVEPDDTVEVTASPVAAPVTAAGIRARSAAVADLPPMDAPMPAPAAPEAPKQEELPAKDVTPAVELIELGQNRRLHALLRGIGIGGEANRDAALAVISTLVEHPVESTKFLTKDETSPLLDKLQELAGRPEEERRAAVQFMTAPPASDTADQLPIAAERHRERETSDREPDDLANTFDPTTDGR